MRLGCFVFILMVVLVFSACSGVQTPTATLVPSSEPTPESSYSFNTLAPSGGGMLGSNEKVAKTDAQTAYNLLSVELVSNGDSIENGTLIIVQKGKYYEYTCLDGALTLTNTYEREPNANGLYREVDGKTITFEEYELEDLAEHVRIFVKK
ncbi:MAG: hypothetical protein GX802_00760 [Clostridiales bacterium]|nr:hypothetical protein [Clostridiales bacterium]